MQEVMQSIGSLNWAKSLLAAAGDHRRKEVVRTVHEWISDNMTPLDE